MKRKKRRKTEAALVALGLLWYRREDYPAMRALLPDGDVLHDTYEEWRASIEEAEREMRREGVRTVHADFDPDHFFAWCRARGAVPDGAARSRYAAIRVREISTDEEPEKPLPL